MALLAPVLCGVKTTVTPLQLWPDSRSPPQLPLDVTRKSSELKISGSAAYVPLPAVSVKVFGALVEPTATWPKSALEGFHDSPAAAAFTAITSREVAVRHATRMSLRMSTP